MAKAFAREGSNLVITGRNEGRLVEAKEKLEKEYGVNVFPIAADGADEEAIKRVSEAFPEMLVGAGTVLTTEQVDRAVNAGAKFIVSPGFDAEIVKLLLVYGKIVELVK